MSPFFEHARVAPKICGITCESDALAAIHAGAGALGFNFYPPSARSIPLEDDLQWIIKLKADHRDTAFVAVVVNPDAALLTRLGGADCFDAIQFHGDEMPDFCAEKGRLFPRWIKALRIRSESDLTAALAYETPFLLLDAAVNGIYGGSGHIIDWSLAAAFVDGHPGRRVILAGGLTPDNVGDAVSRVHPHAVDVASGVESSPGIKDSVKIRDFIAAAMQGR
jgi:phosphoribosylanthranilate isomerase